MAAAVLLAVKVFGVGVSWAQCPVSVLVVVAMVVVVMVVGLPVRRPGGPAVVGPESWFPEASC